LRSSQNQSRRGRQHLGTLPHFSRRIQSKIALAMILASTSVAPPLMYSPTLAQGTSPTYSATIVDYAFQPQHFNVTTGTQVTWTYNANGKTVHTVTSTPQTNTTQVGTPLLNSGPLNPGQSFSYIFYAHGFYPFQCSLHPNIAAMNGWVNVTGSDIQPPPPTSQTAPINYAQYAIIGAIAGIVIIISVVAFSRIRIRRQRTTPEHPTTSVSKSGTSADSCHFRIGTGLPNLRTELEQFYLMLSNSSDSMNGQEKFKKLYALGLFGWGQ